MARVRRRIHFHPALGPAGTRTLVAIVSRDGIPQQRVVLGSYHAPAAPKPGGVHHLRATRRGNRLTVSWARARHALRYVVVVRFGHGLSSERHLGPHARRVVFRSPLVRYGATVAIHAIGPLSANGATAKRRVRPAKVRRIKHFVV